MSNTSPPSNLFRFGQIVYVLSNQTQKIFPAIIEQEIINRRLDGEKVSYIVQMGAPGKAKSINLDKIDGEVYGTMDEVKARLQQELEVFVKNFNDNVDKLCSEADSMASKWYGEQIQQLTAAGADPNKIDPADFLAEQNKPQFYNPQQQQLMAVPQNGQPQQQYYQNPQQQVVQQQPGAHLFIPQMQPVMPISYAPHDQQAALHHTLKSRIMLPDDPNEMMGSVEIEPGRVIPVRQGKTHQG